MNLKKIFITAGDPRGIGSEIISKSLNRLSKYNKINYKIVIGGSRDNFKYYSEKFNLKFRFNLNTDRPGIYFYDIPPSGEPGRDCLNYLNKGIEYCRNNSACALVTAPVRKDEVAGILPGFTGHTEYLARKFNVEEVAMSFITRRLKMSIVTTHIPLNEVPRKVTANKIFTHIKIIEKTLRENFRSKSREIVLTSLNPHGGESGLIGTEERTIFKTAVRRLKDDGIDIAGPFSVEKVLKESLNGKYDFIVSLYHDQILPGVKCMLGPTVNYTMGLPVPRTSPDHGPALDIAGKNKACPESMFKALNLAVILAGGSTNG